MSEKICARCGAPLPRNAPRCQRCGAPRDLRLPVAPPQAQPGAPIPFGQTQTSALTATATARGAAPTVREPRRRVFPGAPNPLGERFAGRPASIGRRLLALTIDVLAVAIVVAVGVLLRSPLLGLLLGAEAIVILVVIQARTGAGLGNLITGIRVAQAGEPLSPGLGRAVVRSAISGLSGVVLVIGTWLQELTGFADPSRRLRTWADRAAGTVVVAVPARNEREAARAAADSPGAELLSPAAAVRPTSAPPRTRASADGLIPGVPAGAPVLPRPVVAERSAPGAGGGSDTGLLLSFDTGQRERVGIPSTAVLGRAPSITTEGDRAIAVQDPQRTISKNHVRLEHTRGGTWITDLGSTNGTSLLREDGASARLEPGVRTVLDDGVRVQIGQRVFTVSRLMGDAA